MLTVARELAEGAEALAASDLPVAEALAAGRARRARRSPRPPISSTCSDRPGVVDAGGAGRAGAPARDRGARPRRAASRAGRFTTPRMPARGRASGALALPLLHVASSSRARTVDPEELERELTKLGDSLLVVGGPGAVKVHVHTDEPGAALALATSGGRDRGGRHQEHARPDRGPHRAARARGRRHGRSRRRARRRQPQALREPGRVHSSRAARR